MDNNAHQHSHSSLILFLPVLLVVFLLEITSVPEFFKDYRPDLLSITFLYFAILEPRKYSIEVAWLCGIVLDLLTGAPFGVNALILASQIYIIMASFKYFVQYALYQQVIIIAIVHAIADVAIYWLEHILGQSNAESSFIIPAITTAIMWPIVCLILGFLCKILGLVKDSENNNV